MPAPVYTATFSKSVPGLRFIDRSAEGFLDVVFDQCFDIPKAGIYDCGPYTLQVFKDGAPFQTIDRANHFYESCWWVDLEPVTTILRGPAELISQGYVPPIGKLDIPVKLPPPGSVTWGGPMTLSSDTIGYEPQTGGRGGIGIVSDDSAQFLTTGDARNMLTDAKSMATQPIWNYDNGKLIDLIAKPKTTHYSTQAQGGYPIWLGPFPTNPTSIRPVLVPMPPYNPSTPQTAHMEDYHGVSTLATGAPRYLRGLQQRVNRGFNADNAGVGKYGAPSIFANELRGTAWQARELFYCYWATKLAEENGTLPDDCLPPTIWKKHIDNQAAQFHKYIETGDFFKKFGTINDVNCAWWQCDMVNQVFGLYAQKWPAEWGPIYIATFKNLAARVNADGLNQWPIAFPTWYWGHLGEEVVNGKVIPYAGGFSELWQKWSQGQAAGFALDGNNKQLNAAEVAAINKDFTNGDTFVRPGEYQSWAYGALAFAVYLDRGVLKGAMSAAYPNLEQAFSKYHAMMKKWVASGGHLIPQCSISVTPNPPIVVPPPPPPTGEIIVSDPAFNAPFTATVSFKDNKGNPMVPDTVAWNAPAAFALTADQTNKLVAHGVYGVEGAAVIQATGVKDGVSVTVTKEVTVPAAPPFLAAGEITLT